MAKCQFCGKGVNFGVTISHSHIRTNRTFKPNVKKSQGARKRNPEACLRLHEMPALR